MDDNKPANHTIRHQGEALPSWAATDLRLSAWGNCTSISVCLIWQAYLIPLALTRPHSYLYLYHKIKSLTISYYIIIQCVVCYSYICIEQVKRGQIEWIRGQLAVTLAHLLISWFRKALSWAVHIKFLAALWVLWAKLRQAQAHRP